MGVRRRPQSERGVHAHNELTHRTPTQDLPQAVWTATRGRQSGAPPNNPVTDGSAFKGRRGKAIEKGALLGVAAVTDERVHSNNLPQH